MSDQLAEQDWYRKARVRILADVKTRAVYPPVERRFVAGEELEMVQWGHAGREIRDDWWTSHDIDGAQILHPGYVEVVEELEAVSPFPPRPEPAVGVAAVVVPLSDQEDES